MTSDPFDQLDETPVYVISVVSQLTGLHAQTLRQYDRIGLVAPQRTPGGGRRYSMRDITRLRQVQQLSGEGVGLTGVKQILELQQLVEAMARRIDELENDLERAYLVLRHVGTEPRGSELEPYRASAMERQFPTFRRRPRDHETP